MLGEIESRREVIAVTEDHAGLGLATGAQHRLMQRRDHRVGQRVALGGAVEADERDRAVERVADSAVFHAMIRPR